MEIAAPATDLARRRFLKTAAIAGTGLVAATVAACTTGVPRWTERPLASGGAPTPTPPATPSATPAASATPMPGMSPTPAPSASPGGMAEHDKAAEAVVKRFPEKTDVVGNQPLEPSIDGDWKVFELSCSAVKWQIDAVKDPVDAVAFNGMVPGPIIRVTEGDQVRVHVRNDLAETTGIHWHGVEVPNPMDGVPFVTQPPIMPGETFTYEFLATPSGSQMYHSHHNATDQVGRGMLGEAPLRRRPRRRLDQQRRPGRLHHQRQGLPGDRPHRGQEGRADPGPLHERGRHDAPLASPRDADAGRRPRRLPAGGRRLHLRHAGRQPGRALGRHHRGEAPGGLGLPLPHPPPRRGQGGDVRHGDRAHRPGVAAINAVRRSVGTLVVLTLALAACTSGATPTPPSEPKAVTGIVLSIEPGSSPADVVGFTLRTATGELLEFRVGALEVGGAAFPAAHLHEHQAVGEPIRVAYREKSGQLVAIRLEDAP